VEGFLPISSLMGLYHLLASGQIHPVHPAGLFIFGAIVGVSFVFGKSFCSWLCPFGFLSELLGNFGEKIFRQKLTLPLWLDYPLRGVKYLLLAFFVWAVFFAMTAAAVQAFLDSPYNQVADIKMWYFFAEISATAAIVIGGLLVLSVVVRNFWCRYLCPYGALLGLASLLSPHKIRRDRTSCIDCGQCARACPAHIKVDTVATVISDECSTCLSCIDACPVADTLSLQFVPARRRLGKKYVAIMIVISFSMVTGLGMAAGKWHNNISSQEYLKHMPHLKSYGHPTGTGEIEELNREADHNGADNEVVPK
jgi:NAD-dependent dihydropyrimidine dehydrogenase PreA subunit